MTNSKDEKYADIVIKRYNKARDLFQSVADKVEINRNLYKGIFQLDDQYEWDYSLVDQQVFPLIRNYIARSNPSETKIRLEARKPEDFEKRQVNQDFVNWELNELPLTTLLTRAFFSNYMAGKAYFKLGWKYEPRIVITRDSYQFEMRPLINRADMQFVRFNNILVPNRNIPDMHAQPYILELAQLRVGEMMQDNETYGYEYWDNDFIESLRKYGVQSKPLDYEAEFVQDADTKEEMSFRAATFPAVCMHAAEGDLIYVPLFNTDKKIINKKRENPYWHGQYPFVDMTAFPEDDEYYSMSVVDAVGDNQIAATEVLNQTLTNVRAINNYMWIAGSGEATTPDYMFKQRPSGVIRVAGDPNQIVPVRPVDSTMSMLRLGQELNAKFERTGGISSLYSSGAAASKSVNQTARGAQIIDQNIETNVKIILDLFGEQVLKRTGDQFLALNAQYVTEEQTFAVTGKKGVRSLVSISPDQVTANFDVYTMPEAMIKQTPASRQASLQNLITVIDTEAQRAGVATNMAPLFEALIDSYPDMENVEDVVISIDEKSARDIAMLERGQLPDIKMSDDHMKLMQAATIHYQNNQANYTPEIVTVFEEYAKRHLQYLQSEQQIKAMAQPQIPQAQSPQMLMAAMGAGGSGEVPQNTGTGGPDMYDLGNITTGGQ